jgi:hypothetical protein
VVGDKVAEGGPEERELVSADWVSRSQEVGEAAGLILRRGNLDIDLISGLLKLLQEADARRWILGRHWRNVELVHLLGESEACAQ